MATDLSISNVINVSVSAGQTGLNNYNTSNIAIFTREAYQGSFGTLGYKIYKDPTLVATDFGTSAYTAQMATSIFSQKPNILNNQGSLIVIPFVAGTTAVQHIAPSAVPASGSFELGYGSFTTTSLAFGATAAQIQAALRLYEPLRLVTVAGNWSTGFDVTFTGVNGVATTLTAPVNTLKDVGSVSITLTFTTTTTGVAGETLATALTRTKGLVQYFGVMSAEIPSQTDTSAAASVIQTLNKIAFWVSYTNADIQPGGTLDIFRSGTQHQNRGLYYGDNTTTPLLNSLLFMSAYAGRGLSVNFSGNKTTITMHLKDLVNIQPDPTLDQTALTAAMTAGVDTYPSIQGLSKVFSSGANQFFDQVYNAQWFAGALSIAAFNYLATTDTKVPQTEDGMRGYKGALRKICDQAVTNQYSAPGTWTSAVTFGVLSDFLDNISQKGYYIFSQPIASQNPADRANRLSPVVQIALKEAGAVHSGNIIVNVNP